MNNQVYWITIACNTNYEVSNTGIVRRKSDGFICSQWSNKNGYRLVRLSQPRSIHRVHRLVATAFIPNPQKKPIVNHIDCNPANNFYINLEWCSQSDNIAHMDNLGRRAKPWLGKRSPFASLSDITVGEIRTAYANNEGSWLSLAKRFGTNKRTIGRIVRKETYV